MALLMLKAALHRFGRLGFVGALMLALMMAALPVEGQACAQAFGDVAVAAGEASARTAPCDLADCGDCGVVCAHGCCHAPHAGVVAGVMGPMAPATVGELAIRFEAFAPRPSMPSGLERPPRA